MLDSETLEDVCSKPKTKYPLDFCSSSHESRFCDEENRTILCQFNETEQAEERHL